MTLRVRALSATGDYTFGAGSANFLVDSPDAVAQIIGTRLRLWMGEWFLSLRDGVPYLQQILGRGAVSAAEMILRAQIVSSPGVVSVGTFSMTYDPDARSLIVTATDVVTSFSRQTIAIRKVLPLAPRPFVLDQSAVDSGDVILA